MVSIYALGPMSPNDEHTLGFVSPEEARSFDMLGVGFGRYEVFAFSPDGLTSEAPAVIEVTPAHPLQRGELHLSRRTRSLQVFDADGGSLADAVLVTPIRSVAGRGGTFNTTGIPTGMNLTVKSVGWLPTCLLMPSDPGNTSVQLNRPSKRTTRFKFTPRPERPLGAIEGLGKDSCGIDISAFRYSEAEQGSDFLSIDLTGLPDGHYQYRPTHLSKAVDFSVPVRLVDLQVRPDCLICR